MYTGYFWHLSGLKVILGSFSVFQIFKNFVSRKRQVLEWAMQVLEWAMIFTLGKDRLWQDNYGQFISTLCFQNMCNLIQMTLNKAHNFNQSVLLCIPANQLLISHLHDLVTPEKGSTWVQIIYAVSHFTRYSSLKSLLNPFKLFLTFLLSGPDKSTVLDFWNCKFPIFNEFLNFTIAPYRETKNLNYLGNERS